MKIFIDGDASPVKQDVVEIATNHQVEVVIVTSVDHFTTKEYPANVSVVYVDKGQDMADFILLPHQASCKEPRLLNANTISNK